MENINIEEIIYKWFEMKYQTYNKLEHKDSIYLYYGGEKYADIRIVKKYEYIYFNRGVWLEFSEIFPMEYSEFKEVISKWVGNTFDLKGFTPFVLRYLPFSKLEIPLI